MTQPIVFVTYLPKRALDRRVPAGRRRGSEPLAVILASLFVMGGAFATFLPSAGQAATPHGAIARVVLPKSYPDALAAPLSRPSEPLVTIKVPEDAGGRLVETALPSPNDGKRAAVGKSRPGHQEPSSISASRESKVPAPIASSLTDKSIAALPLVRIETPIQAATNLPLEKLIDTVLVTPATVPSGAGADDGPTYPMVYVGLSPVGSITMQGDRVHLASLIGLLNLRMPDPEFDRLRALPSADSFIALEKLRAAGIEARVDRRRDRLVLDLR